MGEFNRHYIQGIIFVAQIENNMINFYSRLIAIKARNGDSQA